MSAAEIDAYLATVPEPKRRTLEDPAPYRWSKGTSPFAVATPLPAPLVEKLLAVRMEQLG